MSIEAMRQALEALQCAVPKNAEQFRGQGGAITALREAIQQAEAQQPATPEPVWFHKHWCDDDDIFYRPDDNIPSGSTPLYTHPAPSVPDDVVRDAERYRWLRKTRFIWGDFRYTSGVHPTVVGLEFQWFLTQAQKPTREDLDAAIDAAKVGGKQ